ncbi:heterokaryon incompatibility protein-domain-containing protein [Xylogone sp. PMI_703]|nr:heterokaryon incompatibility protein-domain-containing protein [Xylogone sp. PMI_703]
MRLLNVRTLEFEDFVGEVGIDIPLYAILSHTWGEGEVSFADHVGRQSWSKKGYEKIRGCCRLAKSEGFQYAWIDTCCIDKSSSAELSEAINSMFTWYHDAAVCYVYLNDVDASEDPTALESSFSRSRWFTRGWTLQELLAPGEVVFFGSDWVEIGTKKSLCAEVSRITGISRKVLEERSWATNSVAEKMSWASGRRTTRLEDEAYCLIGLFNVNMPLLYGEGREAFLRLQQEIIKKSDDQTIFAWSYSKDKYSHLQTSGLMAPSPDYFKEAAGIQLMEYHDEYEIPFEVVNRMVRVRLRLVEMVEALKVEIMDAKPLCHNVIELRHLSETNGVEPLTETATTNEAPSIQAQDRQIIPTITIQHEQDNAALLLNPSDTTLDLSLDVSSTHSKSHIYPITTNGPVVSFSYIYQPVMMAPLRCHIKGYQLCILLTKGSIEHTGWRGLLRLHNPSILAMRDVLQSQLSPLVTSYVIISDEARTRLNPVPNEIWKTWPEIRVASLLSSGYAAYEVLPPGWIYNQSRASVVRRKGAKSNNEWESRAPLVLFYHTSGDEAAQPTFFMGAPYYGNSSLECVVGVYDMGVSQDLEYRLYSFNLTRLRRAQVPLRGSRCVVAKLRESQYLNYLILSIEKLDRGAGHDVLEENDSANLAWVDRYLLPILTSFQKTRFSVNKTTR